MSSTSTPSRRKSIKDSLQALASGLFKKPETKKDDPVVEISGPTGFTRNVHVGLHNGEVEGVDKILEAIESLKQVDTASWDKIQKLKKMSQNRENGESTPVPESNDPTLTESKEKTPDDDKKDENKHQQTVETPVEQPVVAEKPVEQPIVNQEEVVKVPPKLICQFEKEEDRVNRNLNLLQGLPLKSNLPLLEAKKKGFVLGLDVQDVDENDIEIQLLYYTSTKTFLIEPLIKKQPIHKDLFVISLEELVGAKKEGVKSLAVEFDGKIFMEVDCPIACVLLRDSFIAMRKKN